MKLVQEKAHLYPLYLAFQGGSVFLDYLKEWETGLRVSVPDHILTDLMVWKESMKIKEDVQYDLTH